MARNPDLTKLNKLFEAGKDFELSDAEYEKLTKKRLPKDKYYLQNRSALSRKCAELGYSLEVIEKRVLIRKLSYDKY